MWSHLLTIPIGKNVTLLLNHILLPIGLILYFTSTYLYREKLKISGGKLINFHLVTLFGGIIFYYSFLFLFSLPELLSGKTPLGGVFIFKGVAKFNGLWISGGIVSFIYYLIYIRKNVLHFYDSLFPFLAGFFSYVKVFHCFVYGCCFGKPTNSFLGVTFPPGSPAGDFYHGRESIHPVQLYDAFAALIVMIAGFLINKHKRFEGENLIWMAILSGLGRFITSQFRGDGKEIFYQKTGLALFITASVLAIFVYGWRWMSKEIRKRW